MRSLAERAYFGACLTLGRLLRSARYSKAHVTARDGARRVRKYRTFYAPVLIWLSVPVVRLLNTGVWILPQREWEERECRIYQSLRRAPIQIDDDGTLVLPYLAGKTLAALLEDPALEQSSRKKAIERAVVALDGLHRLGFTHADAMAENVLVDLDAGAAHWFDFETVHDGNRPEMWRRADDLRALLVTCLLRTEPGKVGETFRLILDAYADDRVTLHLAASFASVFRRALAFHLAQAGLTVERYMQISRLLKERTSRVSAPAGRRERRAGETSDDAGS